MHINVTLFKICQKHIKYTVSHAKIAQSTELSQHVKQCVLVTLKRDEIVFWTPSTFYFISGLHTFLFRLHIFVGLHA